MALVLNGTKIGGVIGGGLKFASRRGRMCVVFRIGGDRITCWRRCNFQGDFGSLMRSGLQVASYRL
jgi:hypothetical protein